MIEDKHPTSAEISKRLESLENHWQQLRELADIREKHLREAAEAYQVTYNLFINTPNLYITHKIYRYSFTLMQMKQSLG